METSLHLAQRHSPTPCSYQYTTRTLHHAPWVACNNSSDCYTPPYTSQAPAPSPQAWPHEHAHSLAGSTWLAVVWTLGALAELKVEWARVAIAVMSRWQNTGDQHSQRELKDKEWLVTYPLDSNHHGMSGQTIAIIVGIGTCNIAALEVPHSHAYTTSPGPEWFRHLPPRHSVKYWGQE